MKKPAKAAAFADPFAAPPPPNADQSFFVKYEPTLAPNIGRVVKWGMMQKQFLDPAEGFIALSEAVQNDDYYVKITQKTVHPKEPSTAVLTGLQLSGLPAAATIWFEQNFDQAGGATVLLEFDQPGTYEITVKSPTQLDKTFSVVVP